MKLPPFKLERFFARYEFEAPYLMCCSDCEALSLKEILAMADEDTLKMWEGLTLGYTESQGHPVLREEAAGLYDRIDPDGILILAPEEGIFIAMNAFLEPGDHIVSVFPGYQSLFDIALANGCEVSRWSPECRGGWRFDVDTLEGLIKDNTRMIVINFPHNPTGAVISRADLERIVDMARRRGIFLFSDEMYRHLEYDESLRPPSACDLYENAVVLSGMSKAYSLPGARIGWLASGNSDFLKAAASFKDYTTICSSAPGEILAIAALRARQQIVTGNLGIIQANLELLDPFFAEYGDIFDWNIPEAGPIAFPALKGGISSDDFCADLLKEKRVLLLPSSGYDYGTSCFRIGFGRRNMPEALSKLRQYMSDHYR